MANGTQQAVDNFNRANENPLSNGGTWTTITGFSPLQIVSNVCEPTVLATACGALWTAQSWAADQYVEVTLNATLGTSDFVVPHLRSNADRSTCYALFCCGLAANQIIAKRVGGVQTTIRTLPPQTFSAGDVIRFSVFGVLLLVYKNGVFIDAVNDNSVTSGSAGLELFSNTVLPTGGITAFSAGIPSGNANGPWIKKGLTLLANTTDINGNAPMSGVSNQTMLYEGNAQLLTGNVFKMWFMGGNSIFYAESNDGFNWTRRATAVLASKGLPKIFKNGSTYYLYVSNSPTTWTQVDQYTSPDGINWTLGQANVLGVGAGGSWDASVAAYLTVVGIINGTWTALYAGTSAAGQAGTGLATSPDGVTWTKSPSNPVYINRGIPDGLHKVGNTYYGWFSHLNIGQFGAFNGPGGAVRMQTTDFINWTNETFSLQLDTVFEGVNGVNGEASLSSVLEANGQTFQFYNVSPKDSVTSWVYQMATAVAPYTIAQLIAQPEYFNTYAQVAIDNFTRANGALGANWTTPSGAVAVQIASNKAEPSAIGGTGTKAAYTGSSFSNDQYSEVTITSMITGANDIPAVRMSLVADTDYRIQLQGPTGSVNSSLQLFKRVVGVSTAIGPTTTIIPQVGDVFRLSVVGNMLSVFQNGLLILQYPDTSNAVASGAPGMVLFATTAITDAQTSLFAAGNANVTPIYSILTPGVVSPGVYTGPTLPLAFPGNPNSLDLIQVVNEGGKVVYNLTASGVSNINPVSSTPGTILGQFFGVNFQAAFLNPGNLNVLQVIRPGGKVIFYVDYQGNAVFPT